MHLKSKTAILFILFFYIASAFYLKNWEGDWFIFNGDSLGYYTYLPAVLIHKDLDNLKQTTFHRVKRSLRLNNPTETPPEFYTGSVINGKRLIQYTSGVAMMDLPFFLIAHTLAEPLGYEADGYSQPYKTIIFFGNMLYVLLGLWLIRSILRGYLSDGIVASVLLSVGLGTNLLYFTVYSAYMAHSHIFCAVAIFIYSTIQFHKTGRLLHLISIAFFGGLISLLRPNDGLLVLVPLLYGVYSFSDFKRRVLSILKDFKGILIVLLAFLTPILPQLFYWKCMTGKWVFNSYMNQSFDFKHPHILEGLFEFRNGWFAYTPVMFFAVLGIFLLWKNSVKTPRELAVFRLPLSIFLPIHIYVTYSWWCWYYINGFGSRPMIDIYALMAIPLAVFIHYLNFKRILIYIASTIGVFFIYLNSIQTYQATHNLLISEIGTSAFWYASLGKTALKYEDFVAFDTNELQPQESKTRLSKTLFENKFEGVLDTFKTKSPLYEGAPSKLLLKDSTVIFNLKGRDIKNHKWLKVSAWFNATETDVLNLYGKSQILIHFRRGDKNIKYRAVRIENKLNNDWGLYGGQPNKWDKVWFYSKIPQNIQDDDDIKCFVWNTSNFPLYIDDFKVELHD